MEIITKKHPGYIEVGQIMHGLIHGCASDLGNLARLPWPKFWNYVRNIPYLDDSGLTFDPFHEVLSRPAYLLSGAFSSLDCKKKSVLLGSHAYMNGMPYKLIAASENGSGDIHHVFPMVFDRGAWRNADATFSFLQYGAPKPTLDYAEELLP
jgi:hypothetical protein